jgi:hypothetical protein
VWNVSAEGNVGVVVVKGMMIVSSDADGTAMQQREGEVWSRTGDVDGCESTR